MKIPCYLSREDFKVAVSMLFDYKPSKVCILHLCCEDSAYMDVSLWRTLCTDWSTAIGVDYCMFSNQKYLQILEVVFLFAGICFKIN